MIDANTARLIGLKVEWAADTKKTYGTFSGANGECASYLGIAKDPVRVKFSENVEFMLRDVKVFDYPQPIVLIGTDLLSFSPKSKQTFANLGVNPTTATGEIVFYDRATKKLIACELVSSPTTRSARDAVEKKVTFSLG